VQSTIFSFLYNSSLLLDEVRSSFNSVLLTWLPLLQNVNLMGINNVCHGGLELAAALRARLPPAPAA
jgi:hypothetical protein